MEVELVRSVGLVVLRHFGCYCKYVRLHKKEVSFFITPFIGMALIDDNAEMRIEDISYDINNASEVVVYAKDCKEYHPKYIGNFIACVDSGLRNGWNFFTPEDKELFEEIVNGNKSK